MPPLRSGVASMAVPSRSAWAATPARRWTASSPSWKPLSAITPRPIPPCRRPGGRAAPRPLRIHRSTTCATRSADRVRRRPEVPPDRPDPRPKGVRTVNGSNRLRTPVRRSTSKSMVVGWFDAIPMDCSEPPSASRLNASASSGPPTLSSTPDTGSAISASPTTTSAAPSAFNPAPRAVEPTAAITWAPARAASCTANRPTPPDAPVMSTRRPTTGPSARSDCSAVTPATGSAAAGPKSTESGSTARFSVGTARRCAHPPAP